MERNQNQQYSEEHGEEGEVQPLLAQEEPASEEVVAPGVEVVRSNTPRPLSVDTLITASGYWRAMQAGEPTSVFPTQAPAAPPLPEEPGEEETLSPATPPPVAAPAAAAEAQSFVWLFEYGSEMDPALLNRADHLNGQAVLYGPAVLKGYTLMLGARHERGIDGQGQAIFAIVASPEEESEVWGVLYRIPRRLTEKRGEEASLVDVVHGAVAPDNVFQGLEVLVLEGYRDQRVSCLTYVANARASRQFHLAPVHQWDGDPLFVWHLADIARKQKLPESYINQALTLPLAPEAPDAPTPAMRLPGLSQSTQAMAALQIPPSTLPPSTVSDMPSVSTLLRNESGQERSGSEVETQDTDPLPIFKDSPSPGENARTGMHALQRQSRTCECRPMETVSRTRASRRLVVFALYLIALQLVVLIGAVLLGLGWGQDILTNSFAPLGVPWLVGVYGLLGGCLSCVTALARLRNTHLPLFVVITWSVRPFIGAVLALLAYLLLTSGLFVFGAYFERHMAFFWFIGGIVGLCEGRFFFRKR